MHRAVSSRNVCMLVFPSILPVTVGCLTACLRCLTRRNTSVDESYEWDSADAGADSEVPEAAGTDPSRGARTRPGCDQTEGLRDRQQKGEQHLLLLLAVPPLHVM